MSKLFCSVLARGSGATIFFVFALLFSCGGGSDGPAGPGDGNGNGNGNDGGLQATVDGDTWTSSANLTFASYQGPGTYNITGSTLSKQVARSVSLLLFNIPGIGTYPLGTGTGVSGGSCGFVEGTEAWNTSLSGEAGSITLTTLTETRIAGVFEFVADKGVSGGATGARSVTDGVFDLTMGNGGPVGNVPNSEINTVSATLGDDFSNASTIVSTGDPSTTFVLAGSNTNHSFSMTLTEVLGPGTYDLDADLLRASLRVTEETGSETVAWSNVLGGAEGTIVVTSLTEDRIAGSFSGTLPVVGDSAVEPLVVSNGIFDVAH